MVHITQIEEETSATSDPNPANDRGNSDYDRGNSDFQIKEDSTVPIPRTHISNSRIQNHNSEKEGLPLRKFTDLFLPDKIKKEDSLVQFDDLPPDMIYLITKYLHCHYDFLAFKSITRFYNKFIQVEWFNPPIPMLLFEKEKERFYIKFFTFYTLDHQLLRIKKFNSRELQSSNRDHEVSNLNWFQSISSRKEELQKLKQRYMIYYHSKGWLLCISQDKCNLVHPYSPLMYSLPSLENFPFPSYISMVWWKGSSWREASSTFKIVKKMILIGNPKITSKFKVVILVGEPFRGWYSLDYGVVIAFASTGDKSWTLLNCHSKGEYVLDIVNVNCTLYGLDSRWRVIQYDISGGENFGEIKEIHVFPNLFNEYSNQNFLKVHLVDALLPNQLSIVTVNWSLPSKCIRVIQLDLASLTHIETSNLGKKILFVDRRDAFYTILKEANSNAIYYAKSKGIDIFFFQEKDQAALVGESIEIHTNSTSFWYLPN